MDSVTKLQAKLDRAEAEIEKAVEHLVKERAVVADRVAEGKDVTLSRDLLVILEDAHLVNTQHRDRLRREMDVAVAART